MGAPYLLEAQACGAAFGHAELPNTHHGAGPGGDDGRGGRARGTETAAPGGQVLDNMLMALVHRYCYKTINHSRTRMHRCRGLKPLA